MLYLTSYSVKGSRCNGTYLVNANTKREANSILKAVDADYYRIFSQTREEYGDEDFDFMIADATIPELGCAEYLESGT